MKTKFVPYAKLSKKAKRELDIQKRSDWGNVRPVTQIAPNPKAYKRHARHKGSAFFHV